MEDPWGRIEAMVSELGELYALEAEVAAFPEVSADPVIQEVHLAVLRATDEMTRIAGGGRDPQLDRAREALSAARSAADSARLVLLHARSARNRDH